jgi:hypothetical protein
MEPAMPAFATVRCSLKADDLDSEIELFLRGFFIALAD